MLATGKGWSKLDAKLSLLDRHHLKVAGKASGVCDRADVAQEGASQAPVLAFREGADDVHIYVGPTFLETAAACSAGPGLW